MALNLLRLCVGCESIEHLRQWQTSPLRDPLPAPYGDCVFTVTSMVPKRVKELCDGGSLYWVIKGRIAVRQSFVAIDSVQDEVGRSAARLILKREWVETVPTPCRPFQGWRYLDPERAPPDLAGAFGSDPGGASALPPEMIKELKDLGLI